eukprot:GHVU01174380.1.p1 GENE.GHVU01174380.1~~GHVU01174380.1.p1  ORF type:complete len:105 (-),score=0.55 GHVU01174380.1:296-610(-)
MRPLMCPAKKSLAGTQSDSTRPHEQKLEDRERIRRLVIAWQYTRIYANHTTIPLAGIPQQFYGRCLCIHQHSMIRQKHEHVSGRQGTSCLSKISLPMLASYRDA